MNFDQSNQNDIQKRIINFYRSGGQYSEKEIDFGQDVGREYSFEEVDYKWNK